ncbi:unnamed protein product [Coffea canephora]|uniref:S-acyltransferase n=1 Tax=Coffea canephora TaxID=49390 RepID=A0A068V6A4_COFCA|nr:unnamed protein product [Coffea canephora]
MTFSLSHTPVSPLGLSFLTLKYNRSYEYCFLLFIAARFGIISTGRYCQKCTLHKPPRAHHYCACNRCVLRMDHHCVWLNNCVGYANYKNFFIFVIYTIVSCIYSLVCQYISFSSVKDSYFSVLCSCFILFTYYLQVISGLLLVLLTLALTIFMFWHVYLILQNKTTIEYHEGVRAMWLAEKGGYLYSYPYDLGAYENMISVLGPNTFCWVCPSSEQIGYGLHFHAGVDKLAGISF